MRDLDYVKTKVKTKACSLCKRLIMSLIHIKLCINAFMASSEKEKSIACCLDEKCMCIFYRNSFKWIHRLHLFQW